MTDDHASQIEDFLFHEADLLDQWRLPEWLELFTEDAEYQVPCMDLPPDANPDTTCSILPTIAFGSASASSG